MVAVSSEGTCVRVMGAVRSFQELLISTQVGFFRLDSKLFSVVQIDSKRGLGSKAVTRHHHHHRIPQFYVPPWSDFCRIPL
jgi:hypothetical protein